MSQLKKRLLAASMLVFGGLAAVIGFAAIPGPNGVIQGCYDGGGNLKVVSALPCPKNWTPLQWSQQGIKGDTGEKGEPGAKGDTGAPGEKGDKGEPGTSGLG